MNKFSYLLGAGLLALPLIVGVTATKEAQAARNCPHLDKYLNRVKGSSIPYKVYFLSVSGLEDRAIPRRARAKFARNLLAEWQKKDGFFTDFSQEGCSTLSFTFPEAKKYRIRSSTGSSLVLEGMDRRLGEHGTVKMSSSALASGNVALNITFDFKFVDGCEDGGSIVKPITIRAIVAWGKHSLDGASERASYETTTKLTGYAGEWEEAAGCEKREGEKRDDDKREERRERHEDSIDKHDAQKEHID